MQVMYTVVSFIVFVIQIDVEYFFHPRIFIHPLFIYLFFFGRGGRGDGGRGVGSSHAKRLAANQNHHISLSPVI